MYVSQDVALALDSDYTVIVTCSSCFLITDKNRKHHVIDADDEADDDFGNLSLMTSSTCTSTKTLNTISNEPVSHLILRYSSQESY